jgi:4-diphosphocytidyl-2-C-methyl-D-erythritol kinase
MLAFPNAKINLGLHITSRRADGFHNIETILLPVPLCDALDILPAPDKQTRLFVSGVPLPENEQPNLCLQAYEQLAGRHKLPPVHIYLHKCIPSGAGLGGGSANAAFTLIMLNRLFKLSLSKQDLMAEAGKLGSDCPFFIENKPMLATGKGNRLTAVEIPALKKINLVVVTPPLHVSTAKAYAGVSPKKPVRSLTAIIQKPLSEWTGLLKNDFEPHIFSLFPAIASVRDQLTQLGATYTAMSGSGSSVFALFKNKPPDHLPLSFPDCQINGPFVL